MKAGEVLWTHELQTIPMPRIEALAGYDYLNLVIDQVNAFSFSIFKIVYVLYTFLSKIQLLLLKLNTH